MSENSFEEKNYNYEGRNKSNEIIEEEMKQFLRRESNKNLEDINLVKINSNFAEYTPKVQYKRSTSNLPSNIIGFYIYYFIFI